MRSPGEHYDEGVAFQLALDKVPHRFSAAQGVCVDEVMLPEVDKAMRRLDRYFWKVDRALELEQAPRDVSCKPTSVG